MTVNVLIPSYSSFLRCSHPASKAYMQPSPHFIDEENELREVAGCPESHSRSWRVGSGMRLVLPKALAPGKRRQELRLRCQVDSRHLLSLPSFSSVPRLPCHFASSLRHAPNLASTKGAQQGAPDLIQPSGDVFPA